MAFDARSDLRAASNAARRDSIVRARVEVSINHV
jgi:hypothetical protein